MTSQQEHQTPIDLLYNDTIISSNTRLPKAATSEPPTLKFPSAAPSSAYLVVSLDLDAPFPFAPILSPILHWVQTDLRVDEKGVLQSTSASRVQWARPNPPPFGGPHRYRFILYEQRPGREPLKGLGQSLDPGLSLGDRIRWSLERFERENDLGEPMGVATMLV